MKSKVISGILSVLILALLVIAGPARAFVIDFKISDNFPTLGDVITFSVSAEIEQGEILDITTLRFILTGPQNQTCDFFPNATVLTPCPGIQIEQTEDTGYQMGYGFLPGFLKYNITLDSQTLPVGEYESRLNVITRTGEFESQAERIVITSGQELDGTCSVRGEDGEITFDGETFNSARTKLSFLVPKISAQKGSGHFTAQGDDGRISYNFNIDDAVRSGNVVLIYASGELRKDLGGELEESSIIYYNKETKVIHIIGNMLDVRNIDETFSRC